MTYSTKEYLHMQYETVLIIKINAMDVIGFIIHN